MPTIIADASHTLIRDEAINVIRRSQKLATPHRPNEETRMNHPIESVYQPALAIVYGVALIVYGLAMLVCAPVRMLRRV